MTLEDGTKPMSGTVSFPRHNHVKQTCDTKHRFLWLAQGMKVSEILSSFTMAAPPADEQTPVTTSLGEELRSETPRKGWM